MNPTLLDHYQTIIGMAINSGYPELATDYIQKLHTLQSAATKLHDPIQLWLEACPDPHLQRTILHQYPEYFI